MARTRSGAVAATRVPSRNEPAASANASGTSPARDGQRLGEQVRQMRDGRRRGVVLVGAAAGTTTPPQSSASSMTIDHTPAST